MEYRTLGRTGLRVSRIGLGTAELGFAYGLGRRSLLTEAEAIRLLRYAVALGVNYFDTAHFYGLAEERIGKSGIMKDSHVVVATKCGQFLEAGEDPKGLELEQRLRDQVEGSLRNLRLDSIPILMLHGGTKEQIKRGELTGLLNKFQKEGKARFLGISTRGEEAVLMAVESGAFDVIQIAYSILDQRMAECVLPVAIRDGLGVINRSALLKGVLTDWTPQLPEQLKVLQENRNLLNSIANGLKLDLSSLALQFNLSEPWLTSVLVGTNKPENLNKAVLTADLEPLPPVLIQALKSFAIDDPMQVDPSRWPKF